MKRRQLMAITLAAVTAMAPATAFAEESTEAATEAVTEAAETEAATEAAEGETEVASEAAEGETEAAAEAADGDVAPIEGADVASRSSDAAPAWQEYNNLIQQIKTTTDLDEREAMMHQAEDMLMETGAIVPLYYYNDIYLQKENVTGIYSNNYGFKYFMFADAGDSTTLRLNLASEPDKLDPALNTTVDGACLVVNSFNGLCTYDENGEIAMDFADSYEASEDGLTYTFTMKDGLKWSDGSELTAKDFAYSWNRAASAETGADYAYMFDPIARKDDGTLDIEASEDGKTFTVKHGAPCA